MCVKNGTVRGLGARVFIPLHGCRRHIALGVKKLTDMASIQTCCQRAFGTLQLSGSQLPPEKLDS